MWSWLGLLASGSIWNWARLRPVLSTLSPFDGPEPSGAIHIGVEEQWSTRGAMISPPRKRNSSGRFGLRHTTPKRGPNCIKHQSPNQNQIERRHQRRETFRGKGLGLCTAWVVVCGELLIGLFQLATRAPTRQCCKQNCSRFPHTHLSTHFATSSSSTWAMTIPSVSVLSFHDLVRSRRCIGREW